MKHVIIIVLLLFLLPAGQNSYTHVKTISCATGYITTDALNNLYIISRNEIKKFDAEGGQLSVYSNRQLGEISHADATDPMCILLFYRDHNQIVFLDNTLSEIKSPVLLDELGATITDIVCTSPGGGFWLYNNPLRQLQYFSKELQLQQQSADLGTIFDRVGVPDFLVEKNDRLYLNFPEEGIAVFDRFGAYSKTIPVTGCKSFQIVQGKLVYQKDGSLFGYDPDLLSESRFNLPDSLGINNARVGQGLLFIQKENTVSIYKSKD